MITRPMPSHRACDNYPDTGGNRAIRRLTIQRFTPSAGDAYDNALVESVIGLFKAEVIHRCGPWRGFDDVEYATLEWVAWFNQQRLLKSLGYVPPAEFEEQFSRTQAAHAAVGALN